MSKQTGEVRQDGLLYIDRDKAVRQNLESLKKMIRPGNVQQIRPKSAGSQTKSHGSR